MNYTSLVTEVSNYCENSFATVDINTFIVQAEQRIYQSIQFPALRKTSTALVTTISNAYMNAPADFLSAHSLAVVVPATGAYVFLLNKDATFMREAYPVPTVVGTPKYYSLYGPQDATPAQLKFSFGPIPDQAYATELQYFYYPESITVAASGNTWLSTNFDSVLLYGALVEAYTFMKGEADMVQLYDTKFKEALMMAKRLGDGLEKQDSYRSGMPKQPVA